MHVPFRNLLFASNGLLFFASSLLVPLYALFAEDMGATITQVGLLAATAALVRSLSLVFMRTRGYTDSIATTLFQIGAFLYASTWVSLTIATSVTHLFVIQITLGLAMAFVAPSFRTLLAESLHAGHEIVTYSHWELIKATLGAAAALSGGYIVSIFGFHTLFIVMSFISLAGLFLYNVNSRICN